jgi:uncharacterized protein (DUF433 family)
MRIRVKDVLDTLAAGETAETILTDFPDLEPEDIRACLDPRLGGIVQLVAQGSRLVEVI